jgi:hypothetical protein
VSVKSIDGTFVDRQKSPREPKSVWAKTLEPEFLYFAVGGRPLMKLSLNALTLAIPFTELDTDIEAHVPIWSTFPDETTAAVVPAQPIAVEVPTVTILPHAIRYVASRSNRYFVDLSGSFAAYLRKFRAKPRHNLTRTIRRCAELCGGQIEWREFRSPEEMSEFVALAIAVSPNTWQERVGGPGFPREHEFEKAIVNLAIDGLARGYVLFHGSRPIGYVLCQACDDVLLYARPAYDQEYADWSPGTVLLYLLLEKLFAEGRYRHLDFGEGTLAYKQFFATNYIRCARIMYFRRSCRNCSIVMSHWSVSCLSRSTGRVLKAAKLHERLKRALMGRWRRPGQ